MRSRRWNSEGARSVGFLAVMGLIVLLGRVDFLGEEVKAVAGYARDTGQMIEPLEGLV